MWTQREVTECQPCQNNLKSNLTPTKQFHWLRVGCLHNHSLLWISKLFLRCLTTFLHSRLLHNYPSRLSSSSSLLLLFFPPEVPSAPSAIALVLCTGSEMVLSWRAPARTGGAPILGYYLDQKEDGAELWREVNVKAALERRFKVRTVFALKLRRFLVSSRIYFSHLCERVQMGNRAQAQTGAHGALGNLRHNRWMKRWLEVQVVIQGVLFTNSKLCGQRRVRQHYRQSASGCRQMEKTLKYIKETFWVNSPGAAN